MAAALLAQTLRKYVQTGIESYLADAKRHAMTAIGRDSSRLDYFYSGGDYDPRLVPYQFDGILSGDAAPRAAQARLAARALRSQEWVPFLGETRNWLIRFGYMARDAEYCLESEQALDDLASVGVALAETAYQSIARDQRRSKGEVDPGRTELDLAMTGLISEIAKLPRQPPRPQRSVAGATFKKRAGKALRRPRIVWEFLSWILIMLITTSFVTFVAASIWHLTEETIAVMIVPTTVIGAATITGIRAGRPSTEAVESSEDLRRPT
jgi:hypothetical protein